MRSISRPRKRSRLQKALNLAIGLSAGSGLALAGFIFARISLAQWQTPQPDAILMLGGGLDREEFTAQFSRTHPDLPIWVSSGVPDTQKIFQQAGIAKSRLHLDCRATDTVTNFTTLVERLEHQNSRHVYLITSSYHLPRAQTIATIVFGSRGITFTAIPVYERDVFNKAKQESLPRTLRDLGRSLVWLLTGRTGASLRPIAPADTACTHPNPG